MFGSAESLLHHGPSKTVIRKYRSRDGRHDFQFRFVPNGAHMDVYCLNHPSLDGRDDSVRKTHLYDTGKICFVSGKEPYSLSRALELTAQWAEYFLEYRRTGIAQE